MAITTFAAIVIGSNEISMKIFEVQSKKIFNQVDYIRFPIMLGSKTYAKGELNHDTVNEICDVLKDFCRIMKEYKVSAYTAVATSAIREAANSLLVIDRIELSTGIKVDIISNSKERFISYKALANKMDLFKQFKDDSAIILDIGAGSIQLSIFNNNTICSTQNINLGFLRVEELLSNIANNVLDYTTILFELVNNDLATYSNQYLSDIKINNIIISSDNYINTDKLLGDKSKNYLSKEAFNELYNKVKNNKKKNILNELGINQEDISSLTLISMIIYRLISITDASNIYLTDTTLNDGLFYNWIEDKYNFILDHDFSLDTVLAAKEIAKKYKCNMAHNTNVETNALTLFDKLSKLHGLGKRERILLQIAILLHNCGEFVNTKKSLSNSHHIILETEILGISHKEREMIANIIDYNFVVKNNNPDAIRICKIAAILRLANSLDKSHLQKIKKIDVSYKESEIVISFKCDKDVTLEKLFFEIQAKNFALVYGIVPKIKQLK